MPDNTLLKAIEVGLRDATRPGPSTAERIAAVLHEHGMVLPPGITISAVYRVVRPDGPCGQVFTSPIEAAGFLNGQPGHVEMAWRVRSGSVDVITGWGARP